MKQYDKKLWGYDTESKYVGFVRKGPQKLAC
jgi:hypothetical protein